MSAVDMFPEVRVDPMLDKNRRYTQDVTVALCKRLGGVEAFDLDVAADQWSHLADRYFCAPGDSDPQAAAKDGLAHFWDAGRVWCNPPFDDLESWVAKAWAEARRGPRVILMLLPANRAEQAWWQRLVEPFRDGRNTSEPAVTLETHHLPSRARFAQPSNPTGAGVGSPPFGCVLLVWRSR